MSQSEFDRRLLAASARQLSEVYDDPDPTGAIPVMKRKLMAVRVSTELATRVEQRAERSGQTSSEFVRQAIEEKLAAAPCARCLGTGREPEVK